MTNSEEDVKKVSDALALADKISKEITENKCTGYISYTTLERDGGKVSESYQVCSKYEAKLVSVQYSERVHDCLL